MADGTPMVTCDVLIIGGGPAGSSCAWRLRQAGLDVIVADASTFPRDKVCAGWITPQVVAALCLDLQTYSRRRTFQPFRGFLVGLIGVGDATYVGYDHPVSFGIRRCEFDHYLLQRADARLMLGTPIASIRRDGREWVVNDAIRARLLVGAGGSGCPVARLLNGREGRDRPRVVAQETELRVAVPELAALTSASDVPELFFCRDLQGYGWCVRQRRSTPQRRPRPSGSAVPAGRDAERRGISSERGAGFRRMGRGDGAAIRMS